MPTTTASGAATQPSTLAATTAAVKQALAGLGGRKPSFGFLFAGPGHALGQALAAARDLAPGAELIGASTAGEITERGLTHGGVSVLLVATDEMVHEVALAQGVKGDFARAASALCGRYGEAAKTARSRHYPEWGTTVVLVDGLAGTGEKLVGELLNGTRPYQQIVGGAAGDEGKFVATQVGGRGEAATDSAAVLHAFGPDAWGVGVDHGLRPSTPKMTVTRAAGNVVKEIDGKPAFEVYRAFAKEKGVDLTPDKAGAFLINHEIGVYFMSHLQRARAPLSVGADGSLTCAADIAEGAQVSLLDGRADDLVAAARNAASEAARNLRGARPAGVLLFDCICRGMMLDRGFGREIEAVRSVFPGVPIAGFLTYGEIARYKGKLDGWHNTTAVVTAIPSHA